MANILIVDDRAANRDYLVTLLGYQGHTLLEAEDGTEALSQLDNTTVDLIITDVLMPSMDGYTLVKLLKKNAATAGIPVVFYTITYSEHDAQAIAKGCGVDYILQKPSDPEDVLLIVNAALRAPAVELNQIKLPRHHTDIEALRLTNLRLETLVELGKQQASGRELSAVLEPYGQATREICTASQVIITLADNAGEYGLPACSSGFDRIHRSALHQFSLSSGKVRDIMVQLQPCSVLNLDHHAEALGLPRGFPDVSSLLAVPIQLPEKTLGWLWLFNKLGKSTFSGDDQEMAVALAAQLASVLQNQTLYENLNKRTQQLEQEIVQRRGIEDALRRQHGQMKAILDNSTTPIYLTDLDGNYLLVNPAFAAILGVSCDEVIGKSQLESFPSAFAERHHGQDQDILELGRPLQLEQRVHQPDGEHTYLAVKFPLIDASGNTFGIGGICTDITERKRYEQLEYIAHHDALTGLANVVLLKDRLERAIISAKRQAHGIAILFLDLDRFKIINDTLGHGIGDQVLRILAERLQRCVRANDTVARLGGDEFVIVLTDIDSGHDVVKAVEKILEATAKPVHVAGACFSLSISVGISLYPQDGEDIPALMRNADRAMYRAKAGISRYQFYQSARKTPP